MSPTVSLTMPAYIRTKKNLSAFLGRSAPCLFGQTYKNAEILFVVNGSCAPESELRKELDKMGNYRMIFHPSPLGVGRSINECIKNMSPESEFFTILGADDTCSLEKTEKQIAVMLSRPEVGILGTDMIDNTPAGPKRAFIKTLSPETFAKEIEKRNLLCGGSVMIRREVFDKVGLFDERKVGTLWPEYAKKMWEDWEFWIRATRAGIKIEVLEEPLYTWFHDCSTPK